MTKTVLLDSNFSHIHTQPNSFAKRAKKRMSVEKKRMGTASCRLKEEKDQKGDVQQEDPENEENRDDEAVLR